MAITDFPNDAVCMILVDIPGEGEFQGSGVIIGPHTILTVAHLLYNADAGATADRVSVYPGFEPNGTYYNPPGALPGDQTIHTIKVPDYNDELSAVGTQRDFAVIDTSIDLSAYGAFALDPNYTSGDIVLNGYPAKNRGYQAGTGGVLSQDGSLSDIDTSSLSTISPGYSGGPLWDRVERGGASVPAVVGLVSTQDDAMKLTRRKVALINYWIASDELLYAGASGPNPLVQQITGTVSSSVDRAPVAPSAEAATLAAAIMSGGDAAGGAALAAAAPDPAASTAGRGGHDGHRRHLEAAHGASAFDFGTHHHRHGFGV